MLSHTLYVALWPKPAGGHTAPVESGRGRKRSRQGAASLVCGARVPLDHGRVDADAARHVVRAHPRMAVRLGADSLSRGHRADDLDHLSHHPRELLARLLVDLAQQGRCERGHHAVQTRDRRQGAGAAQGREISVGQQDVSHGHRPVGAGGGAHGPLHDGARPQSVLRSQSVPLQRRRPGA